MSSSINNRIVNAIIKDLRNRRGLSQEWDSIDEDIQKEIVEKWERIVGKHILQVTQGAS